MSFKITKLTILLTVSILSATVCHAVTSTTATGDTIRLTSEKFLPAAFNNNKVSIFIDGGYRLSEPSEFTHMLHEDWYNLYRDESTNDFILEKAAIEIAKEYDECLGDSTTYVTSRDAILMVKGLPLKDRKLESFTPEVTTVQPGQKLSFTFNDIEYTLRASGIYTDENNTYIVDGFPSYYHHNEVINYKIYLYAGDKKQLLISVPRFNDTFVQLLFIGDLDEDGKPDFVFDTSREYEERRVTLFLSSPAKDKEIVQPIDEASYQFDC